VKSALSIPFLRSWPSFARTWSAQVRTGTSNCWYRSDVAWASASPDVCGPNGGGGLGDALLGPSACRCMPGLCMAIRTFRTPTTLCLEGIGRTYGALTGSLYFKNPEFWAIPSSAFCRQQTGCLGEDGMPWRRRENDLGKLDKFRNGGNIHRIFTTATSHRAAE
jgi:hypothetical protein